MHCPYCRHDDTRVIDSRLTEDGLTVRRRRECPQCNERFNTFEHADLKLPAIVKQDGRREPFDERKLRAGIELALHKRPFGSDTMDSVIDHVVKKMRTSGERELPSRRIGEWVMGELKRVDQVAYVRFASVYRRFEDAQAFREEVERLERDPPQLAELQLSLLGDDPAPPRSKR